MNKAFGAFIFAGLSLAISLPAIAQNSLALKRVTLSSGGVGYFEYETVVDGDAEISLPVRLDQVDDVLKSLVIRDTKGTAATLRLAGREPLSQIFRNLPINQGALTSPEQLLNALKGSEVKISGARTITGRIVAVVAEKTRLGDGLGETTRHRVSLLTSAGLQHFILENSQSIQFTDPKIVSAVDRGLAAIAENRTQDQRTLLIKSSGKGRRSLSAGYVVRVPVWKTTYRLILPALDTGSNSKVRLEGWAILENMSAQDWNDVELTLISGNPVTFRQSLYSAYYVNRPEVPIALNGRLLPRTDRGAVNAAVASNGQSAPGRNFGQRRLRKQSFAAKSRPMVAAADMLRGPAEVVLTPPGQPLRQNADAEDSATQIVFRLPGTISVKTGHSLSVRFLNREIPAERVALYQPDTHTRYPLAAIRIKNDGKSGLPSGALTFYDAGANGALSFVGDAQLKTLPVSEERILSYALDNKITIDREASNSQSILKGKISKGLLEITRMSRRVTSYRIKHSATKGRRLLIEQARQAGWKLTKPDEKAVTLTPRYYRIPHQLNQASTDRLDVILHRPILRSYRLTNMSRGDALVYAGTDGFDPPMRKAFTTLAKLKNTIDQREKNLNRLESERKRWAKDQARLRENLSKVPRNSDIHRKYLKRLSGHETKIEGVMGKIDGAQASIDKAKTALSDFAQNLKL